MATETTIVNIFKIGNVLDPQIRIEGECAACDGTGAATEFPVCKSCSGTGKADSLVRLSELITMLAPTAQWVGTVNTMRGDSPHT